MPPPSRRVPRLVLVSGQAGVGKSRLGWEFEKYADGLKAEVWWHRGRCLSYGEGVAFWALAQIVRQRLARETAAEIRARDHLELIREPELGVVLFRRRGWDSAAYTRWADRLLTDQVAFIPPSAWEGQTVARFAFLHPHTSIDLVRQILDRMASGFKPRDRPVS